MDALLAHATVRFGLGRCGNEAMPGNAVDWLHAQIHSPDPMRFKDFPSASQCLEAWRLDGTQPLVGQRPRINQILEREKRAALDAALTTTSPFRERLVWFWANHFTVSLARLEVVPTIGAFVREAIRPHVTGRFGDMLLAVMRHPAMLMYLDNAGSVGPRSPYGVQSGEGLNENLGRECLELHTVGVGGGYSQADVTSFSNVITGWTVDFGAPQPDFAFNPITHEPGEKTVMGRTFTEGEQAGVDALAWLADHPATHRFLATKLVRHFVADAPLPADIDRIAAVFQRTQGDLAAVAMALTGLPGCWAPLSKLRTPAEYVVAAGRALRLTTDTAPDLEGVMAGLGQPLWAAPLPNGWPDRAMSWAGPETLLRRAEWSANLVAKAGEDFEPLALADTVLGPLLRATTREQIEEAGSRRVALTLLMASPEFQRR